MPRTKGQEKRLLKAWIPLDLRARLDLELVSAIEGRIPLGDISEFVTARLKEWFESDTLDLSLYGFPAGYFVRGPAAMIVLLKQRLEKTHAKS